MSWEETITTIINQHMNPTWSPMDPDCLFKQIPLNSTESEYIRLQKTMEQNFLKILFGIERIQHPILYEQFQVKVAERRLYGDISIRELFHSTATQNVLPIIMDNLDWRVCQRIKYGRGISFSNSTSYANLESSLNNGINRAMIVADVIVGNQAIGNSKTIIPHDICDTTINTNKTVFVKYYDNEYYPKYVIFYETYPVISNYGRRSIVR